MFSYTEVVWDRYTDVRRILRPAYRMFNDERISSADRLHFRLG